MKAIQFLKCWAFITVAVNAQTPTQVNSSIQLGADGTPVINLSVYEGSQVGGSGANQTAQLVDWKFVRVTDTQLRFGDTCLPTSPCNVNVGGMVTQFTGGPYFINLSGSGASGSIYVYVSAAGTLTVGVGNGLTTSDINGSSSLTLANNVNSCPQDGLILERWNVSAGIFDSTGYALASYLSYKPSPAQGTGIAVTLGQRDQIAIDTTTVPRKFACAGGPAITPPSGAAFNDTCIDSSGATATIYVCTNATGCKTAGDWKAAGGSASGVVTPLLLASTPLTARGDLLVVNSTPALARLAKGAQYQTLTSGSIDTVWDAIHLDQPNAITGILPTWAGGTGTSTPGLLQGSNITITGVWPNQTINSTGGALTAPFNITTTDPLPSDPNQNNPFAFLFNTTSANTKPGFTNEVAFTIKQNSTRGQQVYYYDSVSPGNSTYAKKTMAPLIVAHTATAAGQKLGISAECWSYGQGDCIGGEFQAINGGGTNASGDEGTFALRTNVVQDARLYKPVISAVARSGCQATSLAVALNASNVAQTFAVNGNTTNCAGGWIMIGQDTPIHTVEEEVLVAVVDGTHLSGIVMNNHASGASIRPATVLTVDTTANLGQLRWLVSSAITPYTTGQVNSAGLASEVIGGTGGMNWTAALSGSTPQMAGCFSLMSDDVAGATVAAAWPYGADSHIGLLRSWYPIKSIDSATQLHINGYSLSSPIYGYSGNGVGSGGYRMARCNRIMRIVDATHIVMAYDNFGWSNGEVLEQTVDTSNNMSGFAGRYWRFTPTGSRLAYYNVSNNGLQTMRAGFMADGALPNGVNGFDSIVESTSAVTSQDGIKLSGITTNAALDIQPQTVSDNKQISWGNNVFIQHTNNGSTATPTGVKIGAGGVALTVNASGAHVTNLAGNGDRALCVHADGTIYASTTVSCP